MAAYACRYLRKGRRLGRGKKSAPLAKKEDIVAYKRWLRVSKVTKKGEDARAPGESSGVESERAPVGGIGKSTLSRLGKSA